MQITQRYMRVTRAKSVNTVLKSAYLELLRRVGGGRGYERINFGDVQRQGAKRKSRDAPQRVGIPLRGIRYILSAGAIRLGLSAEC